MKPKDINRVSLSKSKGGGSFLFGAMKSFAKLFSLYSGISIPSDMSPPTGRLLLDFVRIAVNDCATVSAIPPRTCVKPHIWSAVLKWNPSKPSGLSVRKKAAYSIGYHNSQNCRERLVFFIAPGSRASVSIPGLSA